MAEVYEVAAADVSAYASPANAMRMRVETAHGPMSQTPKTSARLDAFVNPAYRDRIERPIGDAVGLPGAWYSSDEFARIEAERLFARTWICAGYAHELTEPGDVVPVDIAGFALLFTRNARGEIQAFHNVCPHRGTRLADAPSHGNSVVRCPYHAWAFDMNGALRSTPHWGGFRTHQLEGFDPGCHGLRRVRCEPWHDWLFVNIDGEAPPLETYLAPFAAQCDEYDLHLLAHVETVPFDIDGNWKIVEENFLETLHLPPIHVRLSEYAPFHEHVVVVDGPCLGTLIETGLPAAWSPDPLPRHSALAADARNAKNLALFPNFKLVIGPDHCCSMIEFPRGAGLTHQRWDFYFVGEESTQPRFETSRREIIDFFVETNVEDKSAVASLHVGRASPGYTGGVFSEVWEPAVHGFQRLVAEHILGE